MSPGYLLAIAIFAGMVGNMAAYVMIKLIWPRLYPSVVGAACFVSGTVAVFAACRLLG